VSIERSGVPATEHTNPLTTALTELRDAAAGATLALDGPRVRAARQGLIDQIDHYLLPRLRDSDAPLLVVVTGSTGVGKSTIVNTVAGVPVSPAGAIRPTTRHPVLACHPDDAHWFGGDRLGALTPVTADGLTVGLAVADTPDLEAVADAGSEANIDAVAQLLAAADLRLFVTTAARYADAVPWNAVAEAARQGTALAIVLDRVPAGGGDVVREHLDAMLDDRGLDVPVLVVEQVTLTGSGLLPADAAKPVVEHLHELAGDTERRDELVRRAVAAAAGSLRHQASVLADATDAPPELMRAVAALAAAAEDRPEDELEDWAENRAEDDAEADTDDADDADDADDEGETADSADTDAAPAAEAAAETTRDEP
jgi:hypothetical protein